MLKSTEVDPVQLEMLLRVTYLLHGTYSLDLLAHLVPGLIAIFVT